MTTIYEAAVFLRDRFVRTRTATDLVGQEPAISPNLFDRLVAGGAMEALRVEAGTETPMVDTTSISGIDRWWEQGSQKTGGTAPNSSGKSGAPEWILYE